MNPEQVVDAYLRYRDTKQNADWWAVEVVDDLVRRDANEGWRITRMLVNRAPSDEALAYVAAGPLEDLLKNHGPTVIDWVEEEGRKNDRLRLALSSVWMNPHDPVWERWYALMRTFGFVDGRRPSL